MIDSEAFYIAELVDIEASTLVISPLSELIIPLLSLTYRWPIRIDIKVEVLAKECGTRKLDYSGPDSGGDSQSGLRSCNITKCLFDIVLISLELCCRMVVGSNLSLIWKEHILARPESGGSGSCGSCGSCWYDRPTTNIQYTLISIFWKQLGQP